MRNFDIIIYGATPAGIICAVEAARQGLSAALVGGWRERHLGGMMSGGLGGTDLHNMRALCGLAHEVLLRTAKLGGHDALRKKFEPRHIEQIFQEMIAASGVAVFWSKGVDQVEVSLQRVKCLTTVDGQKFSARVFFDASYEGDLMARAGVSYVVGRERRNARNRLNGYRGRSTTAMGNAHNWIRWGESVSPHRVPSDPASGLVAGLEPSPRRRFGAADSIVQAYCFRLTMTDDPKRRVDIDDSPPSSFDPEAFELLFRYGDALQASGDTYGDAYSLRTRFILRKRIGPRVFDINNRGAFSLDLIGGSHAYPEASYLDRERIWKEHEAHIRGFLHALRSHPDVRVPQALRDEVRSLGWDRLHYNAPYPGDQPHWPYQLYVRESRRMIGDTILDAADLLDGSLAGRTAIANGSYRKDSHHGQRLAFDTPEGWRVWNEGGFERRVPNGAFVVPLEVMLPQRAEITNLLVGFCISATHEAFGGVRMEVTLMQMGQAAGVAAAISVERDSDIQDVDYAVLRQRLDRAGDSVPFTPISTPEPFPRPG